ncbi:growth arrest-specific protein 6-like [Rhincodon typus]|uniref:growth arrest-specific protein 6-like n=1 Tax=Rhincodon typus TaxID=259920 RepID=UPI00202DCE2A|nr:growth arrest-specific protein 6-like [Rhincodon typus]
MKKVAHNPNIQCPTNIVPGSFFPGIGIAVFRSSDVVNEAEPQAEGWTLSFEATIRPTKHTGLIMALLTAQYDPMVKLQFSLQDHHEHFRLDLGDSTIINMAGPARLCDGQRLTLSVSETEVRLQIGDQVASHPVEARDFAALRTSWVSHQPVLFLGGLPDVEKLGYSWYLYSGCMQDIRLQGETVDFNQAWYKHNAISSHSCPAPHPSQITQMEFH